MSLLYFWILCLNDIEQIAHLHNDAAVVALAKHVRLRVAIDVSQSIVVTSLKEEMSDLLLREFQTSTHSNAIVELVLDRKSVV